MKILTFSSLYPNNVDASHGIFVERRLLELRRQLPFEATVMAPVPWFPLTSKLFGRYGEMAKVDDAEIRNGISVLHTRYPVVPKIGMAIAPRLMALACRYALHKLQSNWGPIALIDAHYFYPDGVAAARLAQELNIPVIITARGSDINLIARFEAPRKQILEASRYAVKLIAVSDALAEEMRKLGIAPGKIKVLRNGVDLDFFSPGNADDEKASLGLAGHVLLSVGALKMAKGHDLAIRFVESEPEVTLVIAGRGPDERALRRLARELKVEHRIRFTGVLGATELRDYYRSADATVLMSQREGMPNVLLESIACGTPVIASAMGDIPSILGEPVAGQLVDTRSVGGLRRAWRRLIRNPPASADVRSYAARFAWSPTIRGLKDVILDVAV